MKTVVGLFDTYAHAETAAHDLERAGISHSDISLVANNANNQFGPATMTTTDTRHSVGSETATGAIAGGVAGLLLGLAAFAIPGLGAIAAAGWLTTTLTGAVVGAGVGLAGALMGAGVPHEDAATYAEGVRRGGTLLAVRAQDEMADRVAQILGADGAVDIDERAEQYRQEGFAPTAPVAAVATPTTATPAAPAPPRPVVPAAPPLNATPTAPANPISTSTGHVNRQGEQVLPVVEEELKVGKREVERGGVRVYSHVTETPVQENVTLREEHVNVERRPVDRPVSPTEIANLRDREIEMRETVEEAVINKQARVVEEVVLNKEATQRTETVRDTVRRTDVEVQPLAGEHVSRTGGFAGYENDFRENWRMNYGNQGGRYEDYAPAYQYGYEMRNDPRYRGRDWASAQGDIQRDWENRQPGTWDRVKNSVRYAWDKSTGSERGGIQTGGHALDGTPDTRGVTEKIADAVTGDRIDDKTGKQV